ncbi:MAG: hypothetical protein U9R26_04820 [Campylobacterota bacterium]|nr:hypothetical protein [Campylobacterota bacterium]
MSWNYRKTAIVLTLLLSTAHLSAASKLAANQVDLTQQCAAPECIDEEEFVIIDDLSEDEWIVRAIWLEENSAFKQSGEIYSKLYIATGKKEYLFKEVSSSIYSKTNLSESLKKLKKWSAEHPDDLAGRRLMLALYMNMKSFDEAATIGTYLLEHSDHDSDLELAANPYFFSGQYEKGVELLAKLYRKTKNEKILMRIAAVEAQYLNDPQKAIRLLETHRRIEDASADVYKMLIDLYVKEEKIDSILEVYKALYEKYPDEEYLGKIIEIYVYNRDFDTLIAFLESNHANDEILYDLYKKEGKFEKAKKLSEAFYLKDNNPKWLAEKAILTYEAAENKNDQNMLEEMISLFDEALSRGVDDSIYLNYYGYTLIDKEIDIDKGMEIISKALEQQPDNSFYLDSLAWGHFKKGECMKAYKIMKKVVEQEGLEEPEIKEHWEKIQKCQKPVIVGAR